MGIRSVIQVVGNIDMFFDQVGVYLGFVRFYCYNDGDFWDCLLVIVCFIEMMEWLV